MGNIAKRKFDIEEETVVELRSLGFSLEDISRMLLVSRWTIHRRVSEFLPRCQILTFHGQPARYPLYLVNLVTKRQLLNILFDLEIHTYDERWQSQNINWKFKAISRTASLLVYDTKWDTLCKARTAFSKRIVKFSVIAMSFVERSCSYSLNNSSKSVKQ